MASFLLIFFTFIFPFLSSSPSLASSPPSALIQSTCNQTSNYDFCVAALQSDPRSAKARDAKSLSAIAVKLALARAKGAASYASKLANNATAEAPLRTCADKYRNAVEALRAALQSLTEENYDYASVNVGAAQEYSATCGRAFQRASPAVAFPAAMAKRDDELQRLCGTALDIITQLGRGCTN